MASSTPTYLLLICNILSTLCILTKGQAHVPNDLSAYFEVLEQSTPSIIGNIVEGAGLTTVFNTSILERLEYSFIPNDKNQYFELDSSSGILRTVTEIDREDICPGEAQCYITVEIAIVGPSEIFLTIPTHILILDRNDQTPRFTPSTYKISFSESDPVGTSRTLPVAIDLDSPEYGIKEYRLVSQTTEFQLLQVNNPINGLIDLKLQLRAELDREIRESYLLQVEALDHGDPPLVGNLVIQVSVEDDNDHSPAFSNDLFEVQIKEDFALNKVFFTIEASDRDKAENGKVFYGFSPRTATIHKDLFAINQTTGEISLKSSLDFENKDVYLLEVTATDMGTNPRSTVTTVKIIVLDVNDNPPQITISTLTDKTEAEISENLPPGKFTAHVSVVDVDSEDNGMVTCSLMHPLFELESMRTNKYKIVTTHTLDREDMDLYVLNIRCSDLGQPPLFSSQNLTVVILDQNDNRPIFTQLSYSTYVPENLSEGSYILHVTAHDIDQGSNSHLTYEIIEQNVKPFITIDSNTGTIEAVKDLDYEEIQELRFTVRAKDGGDPPQMSDVPVNVFIIDSNDESPKFLATHYVFYILENQPGRTFVGQVAAEDTDSPPYNVFDYSLSKQSALDPDLFYVDSNNGNIYTTQVLDHEDRSLYYLNLYATDVDNPSFVGSATVTVIVQDENDNSPVIHFPMAKNSTFPISNHVSIGYNITKIFATDPDEGKNGNITYDITNGNINSYFRIDPKHGFIQTNADLTDISYQEFDLSIKVEDDGEPSQWTIITVTIAIDENVPYFGDEQTAIMQKTNLTIIIIVAAVSGFIIVILVIAIVVLKTTDCRRPLVLRRLTGDRKSPKTFSDLNIKAVEANGYLQPTDTKNHQLRSVPTGAEDPNIMPPDIIHKHIQETDNHSVSSADISNTDSGRGPSEEGEGKHHFAPDGKHRSATRSSNHSNRHHQLHPSHPTHAYSNPSSNSHGYPQSPRRVPSDLSYSSGQQQNNAPIIPPRSSINPNAHHNSAASISSSYVNGAHGHHGNHAQNGHQNIHAQNAQYKHSSHGDNTNSVHHGDQQYPYSNQNNDNTSNHGYHNNNPNNYPTDSWKEGTGLHDNSTTSASHGQNSSHGNRAGPKRVIHAVNV